MCLSDGTFLDYQDMMFEQVIEAWKAGEMARWEVCTRLDEIGANLDDCPADIKEFYWEWLKREKQAKLIKLGVALGIKEENHLSKDL